MIIGKSSNDQNNYNCLVFCARDIKSVLIPNFIEYICPYAMYQCKKLQEVIIPNDSKLQIIGNHSFTYSIIKNIKIPSEVKIIEESSFRECSNLKQIEIPNDSKLKLIENEAFYKCPIESITIPSQVTIKEGPNCSFLNGLIQFEN